MEFLIFLLTATISFLGSIQLGSVNLAVIQTTLSKNFSAGVSVAIGGSIPEIIYSALALEGLLFIQQNQSFLDKLNLLMIPVFIVMGIVYFFQKNPDVNIATATPVNLKVNFLKGFSLGMVNPQILPFWFFISVYINKYIVISSLATKSAFILGAVTGAFGILYLFAFISNRQQLKIQKLLKGYPINRAIGLIFLILALFQVIKTWVD
ncbi:LysE family translocator [Emticicia sp. BO119]|uniref:LysE family translocator n=1 Tax=Emticicia sp. BO119 TaxID=2757768 RepID=UPI0015F01468|nr:LysE family transporter [Emticicia sp. BO119]MBA4849268.1 LysE family transporter [Emticicia sp. BO119]